MFHAGCFRPRDFRKREADTLRVSRLIGRRVSDPAISESVRRTSPEPLSAVQRNVSDPAISESVRRWPSGSLPTGGITGFRPRDFRKREAATQVGGINEVFLFQTPRFQKA